MTIQNHHVNLHSVFKTVYIPENPRRPTPNFESTTSISEVQCRTIPFSSYIRAVKTLLKDDTKPEPDPNLQGPTLNLRPCAEPNKISLARKEARDYNDRVASKY